MRLVSQKKASPSDQRTCLHHEVANLSKTLLPDRCKFSRQVVLRSGRSKKWFKKNQATTTRAIRKVKREIQAIPTPKQIRMASSLNRLLSLCCLSRQIASTASLRRRRIALLYVARPRANELWRIPASTALYHGVFALAKNMCKMHILDTMMCIHEILASQVFQAQPQKFRYWPF